MGLLKLMLLLCVSGCLCQRDCTGVDCPLLQNCIEEVLEEGACCASCTQTGCTCEGYQYYDCVNAGFRKGRVPEGESYFVDFGSTECSCPKGGGRISCHFIPCPELPANCIEMSEPAHGCIQCERIGCEHDEQKYEAGHSFHMDPCQVCHCPNDGGKLMCYAVPNCDPSKVHKPMLATTTEENLPWKHQKDHIRNIFNHQSSRGSISKPFQVSHSDNLPAFKLNPPGRHMDEEEEEEDYDYPTTDSLQPSMHDIVSPTESSIISAFYPENVTSRQASQKETKQELRERFGFHEGTTDMPRFPLHREFTDEGTYTLHKDNPKEDTLESIKDETREAKFDVPEEKPPIYRETTYEEQFSIDRDTSQRQSFGLYKDNVNQDGLEESNTDSEGLVAPTETTDAEMFDLYEDTTHGEAVTDSPVTVDQTTPELQEIETTTTWQITRSPVSDAQNQSHTTEASEHFDTHTEEDITTEEGHERTLVLSNVTDSNRYHGLGGIDAQEENTVRNLDIKESISTSSATSEKPEHGTMKPDSYTIPSVSSSPTRQPSPGVKEDERQPPTKQTQGLIDFREEAGEEERKERENTLSTLPKTYEGVDTKLRTLGNLQPQGQFTLRPF
ncbi:hypothetical protein NFI96_010151 [Prochilodus magdalenae]|nr:hypothetical protein NFI96_010151 [Prochilodus magdalenae]